jgi:RimJ/RimL family protein N-acetyltransferase/lysophospholipase L1-like esterase
MKLSTKRLLLRPILLEDVDHVFLHFTDDLTQLMYPKAPNSRDETVAFVSTSIKNYENQTEIVFSVLNNESMEFLGLIGAHDIHTTTPEIGLWLKKEAHGHKYGLEGVLEIIEYLKTTHTYEYIIYNCDIRNHASRFIAESLSGIPRKTYNQFNMNGKELHYVQYHIYREEPKDMNFPVLLFQGDSITDCNRRREQPYDLGDGYVSKLVQLVDHTIIINKGISGNRTIDLLNRWSSDTINLKPDFLSILIGINEVWHHYKYGNVLTPKQYREYYIKLLDDVKEKLPKTKILMIEPFVFPIGEYEKTWQNDLEEEQKIVKELADLYADYYIPMQSVLNHALNQYQMAEILGDGVHPSDLGHQIIAKEVAKVIQDFMITFYAVKE